MSRPGDIAGDQLRAVVERIETIDEEIKELTEAKKEIYLEAKGNGFDVKILREVIRVRKQDQRERDELETLLEVYLQAIKGAPPVAKAVARLRQRLQQRLLDRGGAGAGFRSASRLTAMRRGMRPRSSPSRARQLRRPPCDQRCCSVTPLSRVLAGSGINVLCRRIGSTNNPTCVAPHSHCRRASW